jgi:rubrerythrin
MTTHTVKTEENILNTFQIEERDKYLYRAFADKAEAEGNHWVAKLFRAVSESEDIHAHSLMRALKETSRATNDLWAAGGFDPDLVKDTTRENLEEAIVIEEHQASDSYTQMIRQAEKDGWNLARECFTYVDAVDQVHTSLFKKALKNIDKELSVDYYVCEACGNTIDNKPSGSCKICGSSESSFRMVK